MITRFLTLSFITLLLVSCHEEGNKPAVLSPSSQKLKVTTLVLTPENLNADLQVPGTVIANESTEIHPEVSGRIVELNLPEGKQVSKGVLLAKLYDGDLQARLKKLEIQLQIAEKTEQRQSELLKIQGISQQEYDLSLLEVKNLKADMDIIKEDIRKTEIRAPFTGKTGLKHVSPGAYVTPASILTTISQVDQLKLQFTVPERYSEDMRNGMSVQFKLDGSSKTFTAAIMATESKIEENTRSLSVLARIQQRDAALIPGAFAKVDVVFGQNSNALLIPNSAIVPQGRKKQVFTYAGGKAQMSEITTGVRDSTRVEVLTGLKAGDTLITSAILFLRPGVEVERIDTIQ